jgi:hypothetical protein
MKIIFKRIILFIVLLFFALYNNQFNNAQQSLNENGLTNNEINQLKYMLEEEKLVRDIYTVYSISYNLSQFENIAESEQNHMDNLYIKFI